MKKLIYLSLIICLVQVIQSAEYEEFTLSDGRVIGGYYDKDEQAIIIPGAIKAAVSVPEQDIVKRVPATPPPEPEKKVSEEPEKEKRVIVPTKRTITNIENVLERRKKDQERLNKEDETSLENMRKAMSSFIMPLRLVDIKESKDPTRSEIDKNKRAKIYNKLVTQLKSMVESDQVNQWRRLQTDLSVQSNIDLLTEFVGP
jgi:hypothetical protein